MSLIQEIVMFLCGFLMVEVSFAQVMSLGSCPKVSAMHNLQLDQYLGKWYEYEKYFAVFELGGKCVTAEYTDEGNGVIGVTNRMIDTLNGNKKTSITGTARLTSQTKAKLEVQFPSSPFPAPYWIVGTDYTNYAVVWSCTDLSLFSLRFAWILTRERNPPESVLKQAYAVVNKNGINRDDFQKTDQSDCHDQFVL